MTLREILHDLDPEKRELLMEHFDSVIPFVLPLEDGLVIAVHHMDLENHTTIEQAGYWLLARKET